MLNIANEMAGITAGAFTQDNQLIGFVFGITGIRHEKLAHWSDMLAVYPEFRGTGIGQQLKRFQREHLLKQNINTMYWTYDPLEAPNANLNWNHLGVKLEQYIPNMYGDTTSPMHSGLPTDRMLVEWQLHSDHTTQILEGNHPYANFDFTDSPIINLESDSKFPDSETVLIEIPANIQNIKQQSMDLAMQWRLRTRQAFQHYLSQDIAPISFLRRADGRCFYALTKKDS